MVLNINDSGTELEKLLLDDQTSVNLLTGITINNISVVSPSVSGLLETFSFEKKTKLGITGCDSDITVNTERISSFEGKEYAASQDISFSEKTKDFISRMIEFRAKASKDYLTVGSINSESDFESYENCFLRMIGVPDDSEVGSTDSIIYYSEPTSSEFLKLSRTTFSEILGNLSVPSTSKFAPIFKERELKSDKRIYKFNQTYSSNYEKREKASQQDLEFSVSYYSPSDLSKFYYLKTVPIQSSLINKRIFDTSKIIAKPFEVSSFKKLNGDPVKTSLLESMIRLRIDSVTGMSAIYSPENGWIKDPSNELDDNITSTECFLIQRFKTVLFQVADQYCSDGSKIIEDYFDKKSEDSDSSVVSNESDSNDQGTTGKNNGQVGTQNVEDIKSTLSLLEELKAREDAVLLLLKDTSSSSNIFNLTSQYSSLDIQKDLIRTLSGFQDVLSGPMMAILSQKAEYLDKRIKELREQIVSKDISDKKNTDSGSGATNAPSSGMTTASEDKYIGVFPEDFIVYILALLSINEDFLIGLLSKEKRIALSDLITSTMINSKKDPYGIIDRLKKEPSEGGYPSVLDSVNALSILVHNFYNVYIQYIKQRIDNPWASDKL